MKKTNQQRTNKMTIRLTALLVAVVFVVGMMFVPTELYAAENETGEAQAAAVEEAATEPAGAEAEETESGLTEEIEAAEPEAIEAVAEESEEAEEKEEAVQNDLSEALTVDLDSVDENEYDGFIYKLADGTTKREIKEMEDAIDDLQEDQKVEEVINNELYTADSIETISEVVVPEQIEYIEPNYILKATGINDPYYAGYGQYLNTINAPYVWEKGMYGGDVVVAVLDSGVKENHEDFESDTFVAEHNTLVVGDDQSDVTDNSGHGTAVAGIIAAAQNNGKGLTGVMPDVNIMPVKVLDLRPNPETGKIETAGTLDDVVEGIDYAVDNGASVINMSFGTDESSNTLEDACNAAAARGVILIAAAGNDAQTPFREGGRINPIEYPAAFSSVVSVGSVNLDKAWSIFSNYNQYVALSAPGEELRLMWKNGGYVISSGTSFAAPQVSAMAAMVKQMDPSVNYAGFMKIVAATSTDRGTKGHDPYYGYGLMNLKKAYDYMAGDISAYEASLSTVSYVYNGKVKTPSVTIKKANMALPAGSFKSTYASGRTAVGTYKVTVTGINGYTGTRILSFKIVPPLVKSIKAPKKGKKKLTVRWKAMSKSQKSKYKNVITGYQVRVATKSNFSNAKYKKVKGISKTSATVKGLKKKTTYYVQYRSYKVVGSATYYSKWSSKKKAKTK